MGTTLASLHVRGGDLEQIRGWMPDAAVGRWARDCVSVFHKSLLPGTADKKARALSREIPQPVLSAWLFDGDAVGISIFQRGKTVMSHICNPVGFSRMGNIPLFCTVWGLPEEDVLRLRGIWKKGSGEEQLDLTAALLGLPLCFDAELLPDTLCERDPAYVDHWIRERPDPPRIKNQAKAELIQELPNFRFQNNRLVQSPFYVSVDPWDNPYAHDRHHIWRVCSDGTVGEVWSSDVMLQFFPAANRILCVDFYEKTVEYDSAGLLPRGWPVRGCGLLILEDGKILQTEGPDAEECMVVCCAPEGTELWRKTGLSGQGRIFAHNGQELIWINGPSTEQMIRIDLADGHEIDRITCPPGVNVYFKIWDRGAWWIAHDEMRREKGHWRNEGCRLVRLDRDLNPQAKVTLPSFPQDIVFSPDGELVYVFLYQEQVLAMDTEDLAVRHVLCSKDFLAPLGFDNRGTGPRFWLQREGSTVEAWDPQLGTALSRHRLKGEIAGCHRDGDDSVCVSTWDRRKCIFRIYRLI